MPHARRRDAGELLPGEELEAGAEGEGAHGTEDLKPGLGEVRSAGVADDGEAAAVGVGGEHAAEELVGEEGAGRGVAREVVDVEDVVEVTVALDEAGGGGLEAGLGELGLEQEVGEAAVDLGPVGVRVWGVTSLELGGGGVEGDADADAELRSGRVVHAEELLDGGAGEQAGVAEDIHEQGVGAVGAVEFAARAGCAEVFGEGATAGDAAGAGVGLLEAGGPGGVGLDAAEGAVEEVAVGGAVLVRGVEDGGGRAVGVLVGVGGGVGKIAGGELAAQVGGGEHGEILGEEKTNINDGTSRVATPLA